MPFSEHPLYGPVTNDSADEISTLDRPNLDDTIERARVKAHTLCTAVNAQKSWAKLDRPFGPGDIEQRARVLEALIRSATEARNALAEYETAVLKRLEPASAPFLQAALEG
ncbi:MAG: hypothetical protein AAGA08_17010 [Pseudomonadota bacterium]